MTVDPAASEVHEETRCWCCGEHRVEGQLVRLGSHPEVGVCLGCAEWVHRRAVQRRDEQRPGVSARLRGAVRATRSFAMDRGWHDRPVLGRFFRWLDRFLP